MRTLLITCCLALCTGFTTAQSVFTRIDSLIAEARYEEATELITAEMDRTQDPKAQLRLARVKALIGDFNLAETLLKQFEGLPNAPLAAEARSELGLLYLRKGRNDLARENLLAAWQQFQDAGSARSEAAANCLSYLGLVYWNSGKIKQAEDYHLIALQMRQELFGTTHEAVAASYNDLGLVYAQADDEKALNFYEKAFGTYQQLHPAVHPKIAYASTNMGVAYRKLKLYGDAVNNFETALEIWKKIYPAGHPNQALVLSQLGQTYESMGNRTAAIGYYQQALQMYRNAYGNRHPDVAAVLNQIGIYYLGDRQYDKALSNFQEALMANHASFSNTSLSGNPDSDESYNGNILLYSLMLKAQALEGRHFGKSLRLADLSLSMTCLQEADTLIDNLRHQAQDESDKLTLGSLANEVYEDGVRLAIAISEMTTRPGRYQELAFYFAEKSKSAVLQESIAESEAKSFAGIPQDLLEEEKNLKSAIAYLAQKLAQKPGEEEEKSLRSNLFDVNGQYEKFVKDLEQAYPGYYNLKFNKSVPSIGRLREKLVAGTALVSYFVSEKSRQLYTFVVMPGGLRVRHQSLPANFERWLKGFNNSLFFSEVSTYLRTAPELSRLLNPHVPAAVKQLIIIPSGRLSTLPFEALLTKKAEGETFSRFPYWVHRYAISYEFAAALLLQKKPRADDTDGSILLCAPVQFSDADNLDDLPGTLDEVQAISQLFGANRFQMALRKKANETLLKSDSLTNFRYLHFATHGVVNEQAPELSRIFLSGDDGEDGHLFAGEIYNLNLKADLAVLSACQTGLGKFSKGEGVIGLSRALVYAGAHSIVVSFWSVADASTSALMTQFYEQLTTKAASFPNAMQTAKSNMARSSQYGSPYYWAPFVLIGN